MKYYCNSCGEEFNDFEAVEHYEVYHDDRGSRTEFEGLECPHCESDAIEEMVECIHCEEYMIPGAYNICSDCRAKLLKDPKWLRAFIEEDLDAYFDFIEWCLQHN